jgi:formate hydrogenlyase subunit 6/NADH:ubiquinone oxidoreductase subunit I
MGTVKKLKVLSLAEPAELAEKGMKPKTFFEFNPNNCFLCVLCDL